MSQAEELLNSMSEEISVHTHIVPDTDTYFIIDPITRKIENTNRKKMVVMQYDHNSERFTFELPRFVDGHDMLECTSVTVNVDNIEIVESELGDSIRGSINSDAPDMTDLRVHPNDPDKVISSWLISRNSTQLAGILSFHIEYKCVASNGDVVYEWGTDTYDEIEVKARKKNGEAAVSEYTDVLEQWRTQIFGAGDSVMANIAAEGETQVAAVKAESETQQEAVELKGAQTLDSIPEDYTETNNMADEAVRSKADAIVCEAAGESIVLKDSSNDHIRGLTLLGKSEQNGTPTPDNPVEIVSVANPTVRVYGKNLIPYPYPFSSPKTAAGVTFTANEDGGISMSGIPTAYTGVQLCNKLVWNSDIAIALLGTYTNAVMDVNVFDVDGSSLAGYVSVKELILYKADFPRDFGVSIAIKRNVNDIEMTGTAYPIVIAGDILPTEYEPYTASQSLILNRTLPGIPVTSGGNYTNSDGQQWICDEIDLERGVYVQRITVRVFDGSDDEDWGGVSEITDNMRSWIAIQGACRPNSDTIDGIMCSQFAPQVSMNKGAFYQNRDRFFFGSGMTLNAWKLHLQDKPLHLAYILATPIETPLTAEEISAFKALRTNYPNTTVLNDTGAWVKMEYNADTKLYVDNKIISAVNAYLTEHLN